MKIDQRWPENGMRKRQVIFDPILSASVANAGLYELSDGKTGEEIVLNVKGMTCGACENAVKSDLLEGKGVVVRYQKLTLII